MVLKVQAIRHRATLIEDETISRYFEKRFKIGRNIYNALADRAEDIENETLRIQSRQEAKFEEENYINERLCNNNGNEF